MPNLPALVRRLRRLPAIPESDAALLRGHAAGDPDAFRMIVERHGPMVFGVCRRVLGDADAAQDAFQATFLVLARRAGSLRRASVAAWLFGVARRVALKARTAAARRTRRETRAAVRQVTSASPADELTARELLAALDEELDRLPAGYREPLVLCYWQGLTQDAAAGRLGCSAGAVKGRLERGRARLGDRLRRRGFGPAAVLLAPAAMVAVPADLAARTVAVAASPWSAMIPAAVLTLAGAPSKLLPVVALSTLLAGASVLALAGASRERQRPEDSEKTNPPVADAPGSPAVDRFGDPLPPHAVARLGTLRYRSSDGISHLVVLPGGRQLAFASGGAVAVMDLDTGQTVRRITRTVNARASTNPVTALALAPDGRTIAVGVRDFGPDGKSLISFWVGDVTTGTVHREFAGRDRPVSAAAFLAGGRRVAILDDRGVVSVWDATTGAKVRELTGPDRKLTSLAASADGTILAAGGEAKDGTAAVYEWDADGGRLLHTLAGHTADVKAVAFSPDGRTLASGGAATVRLWDVATGRELRRLTGHAKERGGAQLAIHSFAFSPDGRTVASASLDWTARAWAVATGEPLDDIQAPQGSGTLAFRDARTLLIGGGHSLRFRDVAERQSRNDLGPQHNMAFLGFAVDGRTVVTADVDSTVRAWGASDGRPLSVNRWSQLTVLTLVSPDGRWTAFTEGPAGQIVLCIGEVATGRVRQRLSEKDQYPVSFSPDGRWLGTCRVNPEAPDRYHLTVWDWATGSVIGRVPMPAVATQTIVVGPNGRFAYTGEIEPPSRVQQWDVRTGRPVREFALPNAKGRASCLAASFGGRRLAAICSDGSVRLWDATTGRECWQSDPAVSRRYPGEALVFSPEGSWLATDEGAVIHIWDARNGKHVAALRGHGGQICRMAFSLDGRRLASTSTDGTALVWDVEAATGRRVLPLTDPARQTELWAGLASDDGLAAHAIDCLQTAQAVAVAVFKERLRPPTAVPADRVAPLIAALDGPSFAARDKAQRDLATLGPGAEPAVRAARDTAAAEGRRRIDAVLVGWDGETRRAERAVEVLEYVANPDARKLLADLAAGDPSARLTRAAKAALGRPKRD